MKKRMMSFVLILSIIFTSVTGLNAFAAEDFSTSDMDNFNEVIADPMLESTDDYYESIINNDELFNEEKSYPSAEKNREIISLNDPMVFDRATVLSNYAISIKQTLTIGGVQNNLYPTFDDINDALNQLKADTSDLLIVIQQSYVVNDENISLDELNDDNFLIYTDELYRLKNNENALISELQHQIEIFEVFLDIYENNFSNAELINYVTTSEVIEDSVLNTMLPYTSPFCVNYNEKPKIVPFAAQTFNESTATAYAKKHATSRNPSYYSFGSDCTNFASQILVAGGINIHDKSPDSSQGWWYKKTYHSSPRPGPGTYSYSHSLSWTMADNFVRFMGHSGNVYSSFSTFSGKLKKGDFIAFDKGKDGSWDHVGYVTGIGTYNNYKVGDTTKTKYYRDFIVAQHTNDYERWVSHKDNGWEELEDHNFAIVRRNAVA